MMEVKKGSATTVAVALVHEMLGEWPRAASSSAPRVPGADDARGLDIAQFGLSKVSH
jgi:hypothetical protein